MDSDAKMSVRELSQLERRKQGVATRVEVVNTFCCDSRSCTDIEIQKKTHFHARLILLQKQ